MHRFIKRMLPEGELNYLALAKSSRARWEMYNYIVNMACWPAGGLVGTQLSKPDLTSAVWDCWGK